MRTCIWVTLFASLLAATSAVQAGDDCAALAPSCGCAGASGSGLAGDPCDSRCCGLFGRKCGSGIDGLDRFANCGCNGSYNYPVPPLYTYHWPGMYKQVRMTDYHSPWRFPPLKKYEDEPLPTIEVPAAKVSSGPRLLLPVSLQKVPQAAYHTQIEPLSSRLSR